jgi:hypothetical protein
LGPICCLTLLLLPAAARAEPSQGNALFNSSHALLLNRSNLPAGYQYRASQLVLSVADWDGNLKPVMAIDERYGWMEASSETLRDRKGREADISVQLFRSANGARGDFGQFFTNRHPQSSYVPGQHWLGGASVKGLGDRATLFRISDDSSTCPQHVASGVTFVYRNGIFSTQVCTGTMGDAGALSLAGRLLAHARAQK